MQREIIETSKGVAGITRPFKNIIETLNVDEKDIILYIGLPGVCTPFIELLSYAIRTLNLKQVYVPVIDLKSAMEVISVNNVGIQFGTSVPVQPAKVIVVLGGLSMPISPVSSDDVNLLIKNVLAEGGTVIGICFMDMFEKAGWNSIIPFDYTIDATIDPVRVEKFNR
ncbi:MAG TPA: DUF2124 family protein [Nitrospirota bacterium]|nr:DUF2124 family protein [Nitrospirota bacterium]